MGVFHYSLAPTTCSECVFLTFGQHDSISGNYQIHFSETSTTLLRCDRYQSNFFHFLRNESGYVSSVIQWMISLRIFRVNACKVTPFFSIDCSTVPYVTVILACMGYENHQEFPQLKAYFDQICLNLFTMCGSGERQNVIITSTAHNLDMEVTIF